MRNRKQDKVIINLLRHGMTSMNLEKRYVGRTDEALCVEGIRQLSLIDKDRIKCDIVISSPMKRCVQTAKLLYPDKEVIIIDELKEIDFGIFEGKNYLELSDNKLYKEWIDSNGTMDFPKGEGIKDFKERSVDGFIKGINICRKLYKGESNSTEELTVSFIIHGGSIMSILERFEESHDYYSWQCDNGRGYRGIFEIDKFSSIRMI